MLNAADAASAGLSQLALEMVENWDWGHLCSIEWW